MSNQMHINCGLSSHKNMSNQTHLKCVLSNQNTCQIKCTLIVLYPIKIHVKSSAP
jgi:hypothetical protein